MRDPRTTIVAFGIVRPVPSSTRAARMTVTGSWATRLVGIPKHSDARARMRRTTIADTGFGVANKLQLFTSQGSLASLSLLMSNAPDGNRGDADFSSKETQNAQRPAGARDAEGRRKLRAPIQPTSQRVGIS